MDGLFSGMDNTALFFLACAVFGGLFVLIQIILQLIGLDGDGGVDLADSDASFRFLSIQGVASFLFMFGLAGFTLYRMDTMGLIVAFLGAAFVWPLIQDHSYMV